MRVLVLRHVPFEGLGRIAPVLQARGIEHEYADLYLAGAPAVRLDEWDGLIVLGGPMSANDPDAWIAAETALIRDAIEYGAPILGICLGAQLIAKAFGADVFRNSEKEIGWFGIEFTEAAADDALFAGYRYEEVFHWHGETFSLAPEAVLLASSSRCAHQAVRYGQKIYGLQFHPEVDPMMISDWTFQDENCGDVRELSGPIDPSRNCERLSEMAEAVFGRWCDVLRMYAASGKNGHRSAVHT